MFYNSQVQDSKLMHVYIDYRASDIFPCIEMDSRYYIHLLNTRGKVWYLFLVLYPSHTA